MPKPSKPWTPSARTTASTSRGTRAAWWTPLWCRSCGRHGWRLALRVEGVASAHGAGLQAAVEPLGALAGRAVGPRLGADLAGGHSLDAIVADGGGRPKPFLDVPFLQELTVGGVAPPHPSEAVGLQ